MPSGGGGGDGNGRPWLCREDKLLLNFQLAFSRSSVEFRWDLMVTKMMDVVTYLSRVLCRLGTMDFNGF